MAEAVAKSEGVRLRAALGTIDALIKTREHGALAARVAELERPVGPVREKTLVANSSVLPFQSARPRVFWAFGPTAFRGYHAGLTPRRSLGTAS